MTNNLTLVITISLTISMPREEISVLSSARREEIRRQLDEAERYRANPVLYIFNPHIRVSIMIMLLLKMIMMINTAVADILQITTQHPVIIETTAVGFLCLPSNIFFSLMHIFHVFKENSDINVRYKSDQPLLFQEWFSRQQLMMVVLFVNVTLAIMFFKLLT